jgi:hypothetical protein
VVEDRVAHRRCLFDYEHEHRRMRLSTSTMDSMPERSRITGRRLRDFPL